MGDEGRQMFIEKVGKRRPSTSISGKRWEGVFRMSQRAGLNNRMDVGGIH